MSHFHTLVIVKNDAIPCRQPPADGAKRVVGYDNDQGRWKEAGWLMPQVSEVDPKTARFAHLLNR